MVSEEIKRFCTKVVLFVLMNIICHLALPEKFDGASLMLGHHFVTSLLVSFGTI